MTHLPDAELVSVIITAYNQAHYLGDAIASVQAQSYGLIETIVVDDGSTDDVASVLVRYPAVQYIRQANQGVAGARNVGFKASRGRYLVFLDGDDRLRPTAVADGVRELRARPGCAFVAGRYQRIDANGAPITEYQRPSVEHNHYAALLHDNYIGMPGQVLYRRSVLDVVGLFNVHCKNAADYELYLRIAKRFPVACHPAIVAEYRRHNANISHKGVTMLCGVLGVLQAEWPHVQGNAHYEAAYQRGMRSWRRKYGLLAVKEVLEQFRTRRIRAALAGAWLVARYHPGVVLDAAARLMPRGRSITARA